MQVNDDAWFLDSRGALKSIASKLAPTVIDCIQAGMDCSSATPAPTKPEYGAVTSHTGIPLK